MTTNLSVPEQGLNEQSALELKTKLRQDPQVMQIVHKMNINNQNELLSLGKESADKLSQFSDRILSTMALSKIDESSALLNQLEKLMKKFDRKELIKEPGLLDKLLKRAKLTTEAIFKKYQTLGGELDKIHYEFVAIETELKQMNRSLDSLYEEDIQYYFDLERYAVAAEIKLEEVKQLLVPLEQKVSSGDQLARIELENMRTVQELLERKVDDLEKARMVAVVAAPQIKTMQRGNNDLVAKINSAFVTTIPVFKMGIIQTVNAKRQKLHSDSLNAFEDRANEMLKDVTKDIMNQSVEIARRSGESSIKIETIENMWETISLGIDEYKKVKDEQSLKRIEDRKKLESVRKDAEQVLSRV